MHPHLPERTRREPHQTVSKEITVIGQTEFIVPCRQMDRCPAESESNLLARRKPHTLILQDMTAGGVGNLAQKHRESPTILRRANIT